MYLKITGFYSLIDSLEVIVFFIVKTFKISILSVVCPRQYRTSQWYGIKVSVGIQIIRISTCVIVKLLYNFIYLTNSLNFFCFFTALFLIFHSPHVHQIKIVYLDTVLPSSYGKLLWLTFWIFSSFVFGQHSAPLVSHLLTTRQLWHISIHLGQKIKRPLSQPEFYLPLLWVW